MIETSIYEKFILPSNGKIYDTEINPNITLRSMTTLEEMKRLSPTDMPYKTMSDIIQGCMQETPELPVYEMSLGDYQYLLHKLRIVTYGPEYKMSIKCSECGKVSDSIADLESLPISDWDPTIVEHQIITLPKTKHQIELKFQTPADLDMISYKAKETKKRTKQNIDYTILYSIVSLIKKVDGAVLNSIDLEEFVKQLPNMDANFIVNKASEFNRKVGLDNRITVKCSECGAEMEVPFRITSEFFGPTIY